MKHLLLLILTNLCVAVTLPSTHAAEAAANTEAENLENFDEFDEFDENTVKTTDPLEKFNRIMFDVNEGLLKYVIGPIGQGYANIIPQSGRDGIDRMFDNVRYPIRAVNNLLQFKFKNAGEETGRFLVNTTGGVLGFYDSADKWFELKPHNEDFGQTLGYWGVGTGAPLTLPLFGPSNIRDAFGKIPDHFLDPVSWITPQGASLAVTSGDKINWTSLHEEEYWTLRKDALDPYTFFRDAYTQHREMKIKE